MQETGSVTGQSARNAAEHPLIWNVFLEQRLEIHAIGNKAYVSILSDRHGFWIRFVGREPEVATAMLLQVEALVEWLAGFVPEGLVFPKQEEVQHG